MERDIQTDPSGLALAQPAKKVVGARWLLTLATFVCVFSATACEAPLSVGERGIIPSPASDQQPAQPTSPTILTPRSVRPIEQLGQAATLASRVSTGRTLPVVTSDQMVRLNFTDRPIASVATDVVRNVLNLPVDVDDTVQGTMTLQTDRVPVSQVPRLLDQALQPYGYGIALINGRVRVGRIADLTGSDSGQQAAQTIRLHYVSASELIAALQPVLAGSVRLEPAEDGTAVSARGPANEIEALQSLVDLFDTDLLAGRSFGIYPLTNANPTSVARELTQMIGDGKTKAAVRFAPIQRLNAVLVVAEQPRALAEARRLITSLDIESAATSYIHVYPVINRRASDIADVLSRLFGAQQPGGSSREGPGGSFAQLSVGSANTSRTGLGVRIPGASQNSGGSAPSFPTGGGQQPPPQSSDILLGPLDPGGQNSNTLGLSAAVRIQQDTGRNALAVMASPSDYKIVEQAIRALDVRPREVLIEAVIAEVQLNEGMQYGLDALFSDSRNTAALQSGPNPLATILSATPTVGLAGQGISYMFHNQNLSIIVKALSTLVNVDVISAPRVLVLDNATATLQVGDQVPILVQQQQSTDNNNAPLVNNIQMRDTGVIMAVTPRIGAGGNLSLDIFQEVSQATPTNTSDIQSPTISVRRLESTVTVETGDTIALGGLMQDQAQRTKSGVPWLSNIPFLGWLFGSLNNQTKRTELLVLLNPRIIAQEGQAQALTEELRGKLRALAPDLADRVIPPVSPRAIPKPHLPPTPTGPGQYFQ